MTNKEKKSNVKKKDLVREVNKESEEKWKGLENKVWTVAEFGFYVILWHLLFLLLDIEVQL